MSNEIRMLSMAFRTDSYHNLIMARATKADSLYAREPMRAKTLVLLHMSIECALKCMITLERPKKDIEHTYKILKKGSHKLPKLINKISSPLLDTTLRSKLSNFNPSGVNLRYGFELMILKADTLFSPGRSPEFQEAKLEEAFELAESVCELATSLHKNAYPAIFEWKNGDSPQRVTERIKRAISNLPN